MLNLNNYELLPIFLVSVAMLLAVGELGRWLGESLNAMIEDQQKRLTAVRNRVPNLVLLSPHDSGTGPAAVGLHNLQPTADDRYNASINDFLD